MVRRMLTVAMIQSEVTRTGKHWTKSEMLSSPFSVRSVCGQLELLFTVPWGSHDEEHLTAGVWG